MTNRQRAKTSKKSQLGSIRIISGQWRGRKLPVLESDGLRPTTDRVKETLFNWLAPHLAHSRCLDLFAGSGGLGFEAASRYADQVTLCELNKPAFQQLEKNRALLSAENIALKNTDSLAMLKAEGNAYDIVFIDPPFRKEMLDECVALLESNGWLAENALIYVETEKELSHFAPPTHWTALREKVAGQVKYQLFKREIV
ncbi:16S rRNA (guanine(966)-N(2))-methyltransferase RsmD [Vibrio ulleungensis]|uniref:Ribosomal RNA small subunit methyltransferase D n=1 Tax=Vibrio ulleungensis TaxID=2807619 RepID=A0ABS2HMD1_9VIBR|nr:16S rRNA (guanine(966)-N(2))-methyltransferase RsmD [Vibrio ulleungensis]MBM7038650.1 16S rRNA (guanine(966)-N(2))-methyltransferase RsmD [Vibrio ulleungensis]